MTKTFKYDVAISVAEEDKEIARQIAAALKKRRIRYYYYEEDAAGSWGNYIINLTADTYGRRSRYVLMITSKTFINKYWSGIEKQFSLTPPVNGEPHILQLRLDNTPVEGISQHAVYREWQNNPEEIAGLIHRKIRTQQRAVFRKVVRYCGVAAVIILIAALFYSYNGSVRNLNRCTRARAMKAVLIIAPEAFTSNDEGPFDTASPEATDSFYISNTEVTVAQFREFCEQEHVNFPPQPPASYENSPIVNVTWYEANAFCKWKNGRLPTEAEWEYAADAGLETRYSGGNNAGKVAVYNRKKPACVASRQPNAFNLYDMTGNVAEWCSDWYGSPNESKSVRGGAYNSHINPVNELAVMYRNKELPGNRLPFIGFRVVWDPKQEN